MAKAKRGQPLRVNGASNTALLPYRERRDFTKTAEPSGEAAVLPSQNLRYVIQKHAASHLHYDLRLEAEGTFKSWAVPKGPPLKPNENRSAFQVEDHPLSYGDFEGTIPKNEYGGGTVLLWDRGYWAPVGRSSPKAAIARGYLDFVMQGEKLHGRWVLTRVRDRDTSRKKNTWLLTRKEIPESSTASGDGDDDRSVASGRTLDEITAGVGRAPKPFMTSGKVGARPDAVWRSNRMSHGSVARAQPKPRAKTRKAAKSVPANAPPRFIPPQLTQLVDAPPSGSGWLHEVKFDGYRIHIRLENGNASLLTRNGHDWTEKYATVAREAALLPATTAYIDGELCAVRPDGTTSFDELTAATDKRRTSALVYFAFDLLHLNGEDLTPLPLQMRKARLKALLAKAPAHIRYVDHFTAVGQKILSAACDLGVEGVVSKPLDAPYRPGDDKTWRKAKCFSRDEFIIVGFTEPERSRPGVGALLMGAYLDDGRLAYAGRAGKGISDEELRRLRKALEAIKTDKTPLDVLPPKTSRFGSPIDLARVHWVRPELVAEVRYTLTDSGLLRDGTYQGLRRDKSPKEVRHPAAAKQARDPVAASSKQRKREKSGGDATPVAHVPQENIMRVLRDAVVPSRDELERYWRKVAKRALKYLARRPLTLVRSVGGLTFFHKGPLPPIPPPVHQLRMIKREGSEGVRVWIDDLAGLLGLVDMDVVELHPWGCTADDIERPDLLVFDLDPGKGIPWAFVTETALGLRDALVAEGQNPWAKTSGGQGLHIMVPVRRGWKWDQARAWTRDFAVDFAKRDPRYTISSTVDRRGKLFIDYLRNGRGSSTVGAFSPRARMGFPVSYPVTWREVERGLRSDAFTLPGLLKAKSRR